MTRFTVEAAHRQSALVLFPELWSTGYDLTNSGLHADKIDAGLFIKTSQLAARNRIYVGGSLLERDESNIFNSFVLFDPSGLLVARYRKIHLFRLMDEDKWLCAGDQLTYIPTPWAVTGLATCYDLRFPEVFRNFALHGVNMALISAEWPMARIDHWRTLLKARAIENQMFVIAANRTGISPSETFGGSSAIIDPWGQSILQADSEEGLFTAEIDLDEVGRVRRQIPVLSDRRPDLYG